MLYGEGDQVSVTSSASGYIGPGKIICLVYGLFYLVAVDNWKQKVILVKATAMRRLSK